MGDPQEKRARRIALFNLKKCAKLRIVTQEAEMIRCMILMHLIKINTSKVKCNLYD